MLLTLMEFLCCLSTSSSVLLLVFYRSFTCLPLIPFTHLTILCTHELALDTLIRSLLVNPEVITAPEVSSSCIIFA